MGTGLQSQIPDTPLHFLSNKTILIAGGGIAGLSFAISLRKQWLSHPLTSSAPPPRLQIYERDAHGDLLNRQGYSMSIREDSMKPPPSDTQLTGGVHALQK